MTHRWYENLPEKAFLGDPHFPRCPHPPFSRPGGVVSPVNFPLLQPPPCRSLHWRPGFPIGEVCFAGSPAGAAPAPRDTDGNPPLVPPAQLVARNCGRFFWTRSLWALFFGPPARTENQSPPPVPYPLPVPPCPVLPPCPACPVPPYPRQYGVPSRVGLPSLPVSRLRVAAVPVRWGVQGRQCLGVRLTGQSLG